MDSVKELAVNVGMIVLLNIFSTVISDNSAEYHSIRNTR